ncbi:MAG: helix-turn-helix transcriptional regulator [Lachnospiraceae bacterium]|nr:helix-turn-helix transcriptional regulator [Lachnospiraceae bacterium]
MSEVNYEANIGKNIKKERNAKNWSQRQLGEASGIANTVISSFENGKTPGLASIVKIADSLGISIDQLIYGDDSESFINAAPNEGRKIVNCIYCLWEMGVIGYFFTNMHPMYGVSGKPEKPDGRYIFVNKYSSQIERLIVSLNAFTEKKNTYDQPEKYLEMLLSSIANEINEEIRVEEEKKLQIENARRDLSENGRK